MNLIADILTALWLIAVGFCAGVMMCARHKDRVERKLNEGNKKNEG